jgi:hypothetical protein
LYDFFQFKLTMPKPLDVWIYFLRKEYNSPVATCNKCGKSIGCKGSTTSALINHLKFHDISVNKTENDNGEDNQNYKNRKIDKQSSMMNFIKKESLAEILSRVAAVDGMSINAITNSKAIKGYVESKGFKMPKSPTTIHKDIL